ncbi:Phage integrase [Rhodobacterales bacterium HTCC2150]|nr:Phage integrase [Rhodobacterales bacterium HTCC2150] [Rhodobacteraceae bacterium HTCC2150]
MAKNSQKPTQLQDLRSIIEEYVDLKSLNRKPLFEAFDSLFSIVGEKPVGDYTRGDARQYVRVYGSKVKTTSVRRRLNSLNAVFNYAIYELDLPHRNPFSRIIIKGEGKDATTREPFSVVELKKLYSASLAYGQLRLILPILGETGCRLSEVLGLMKQDVIHTEDLLVINIRENDCRGLKTENSKRSLPVVSDSATKALQKLLGAKSDSPYLFPRYASCGYLNNTGASATLCKHLKKSFNGKTTHCLRHSFRDRLRDCDVPLEAIDQAGGWSSVGGVGTNYGKGYSMPKLAEYLQRISI